MSISNELQRMMTSTERGTFLTDDKKQEHNALNEGLLSTIGADLTNVTNRLMKKVMDIKSKTGVFIKNAINKIDIEKFKKDMGIKDIQELDQNLSTISVNNPEFPAIMQQLMVATTKAKKVNKELYEAISPIFDRHMQRMVDYYETLYEKTPDEKQKIMYYSLLLSMLGWLDKDRNKTIIQSILYTISKDLDEKGIREVLPDIDKIDMKTHKSSIDEILKKVQKKEIWELNEKDIKKISIEELKLAMKEANRVIKEKRKIVSDYAGKPEGIKASDIVYDLTKFLNTAKSLIK
jgi:hypothetical protein